MKNKFFLACIFLIIALCNTTTAQHANDFYVALSKNQTNDTLQIYISVQKHQNISYEVFTVEVKEKGTLAGKAFQISNRFPYGIINDLNTYLYNVPFQMADGKLYEVVINNKRLCDAGPFIIEPQFSSDNMYTFSYANPGYKLIQPVKHK